MVPKRKNCNEQGRLRSSGVSADYKRFGPLLFVLGLGMASRSNEVRRGIEKILAEHPGAIVDVYCHSNGTKMFVAAAKEISRLTVRNLIFAGSICRNEELEQLLDHPGFDVDRIWNECGLKDRWPVIAEALRPDIFQQTGVRGFSNNRVTSRFYVHGDHGMGIRPKHFEKYIIPILTGRHDKSAAVAYVNFPKWAQPSYVRIVFSILIAATAMGFWALPFWGAVIAAIFIAFTYHQWMEW